MSVAQVITVAEERMRFGLLQKYLNTWTDGPGKEKGTRIVSHGLQLRNPYGEPLLQL